MRNLREAEHFVENARMPRAEQNYYDNFVAYSLVSVILTWDSHDYRETPEEVCDIALRILTVDRVDMRQV